MAEDEAIPISAVPILLQIVAQPGNPNREDSLGMLCDLVSSSFGADGVMLGEAVRQSGGLLTLSWLLAEPDP